MQIWVCNGFKRSVYWNSYHTIPSEIINQGTKIFELLSASFQCVKRLYFLAYFIAANAANNKPRIKDNKKVFSSKRKDWKLQRNDGRKKCLWLTY